jgi:hypothetical protein
VLLVVVEPRSSPDSESVGVSPRCVTVFVAISAERLLQRVSWMNDLRVVSVFTTNTSSSKDGFVGGPLADHPPEEPFSSYDLQKKSPAVAGLFERSDGRP